MGEIWVTYRTFCKKVRKMKNKLTILNFHPIAEDCRENNCRGQKVSLEKSYTPTSSMGGNWVTSRTFCKEVRKTKNKLTLLHSYLIAENAEKIIMGVNN